MRALEQTITNRLLYRSALSVFLTLRTKTTPDLTCSRSFIKQLRTITTLNQLFFIFELLPRLQEHCKKARFFSMRIYFKKFQDNFRVQPKIEDISFCGKQKCYSNVPATMVYRSKFLYFRGRKVKCRIAKLIVEIISYKCLSILKQNRRNIKILMRSISLQLLN